MKEHDASYAFLYQTHWQSSHRTVTLSYSVHWSVYVQPVSLILESILLNRVDKKNTTRILTTFDYVPCKRGCKLISERCLVFWTFAVFIWLYAKSEEQTPSTAALCGSKLWSPFHFWPQPNQWCHSWGFPSAVKGKPPAVTSNWVWQKVKHAF